MDLPHLTAKQPLRQPVSAHCETFAEMPRFRWSWCLRFHWNWLAQIEVPLVALQTTGCQTPEEVQWTIRRRRHSPALCGLHQIILLSPVAGLPVKPVKALETAKALSAVADRLPGVVTELTGRHGHGHGHGLYCVIHHGRHHLVPVSVHGQNLGEALHRLAVLVPVEGWHPASYLVQLGLHLHLHLHLVLRLSWHLE